MNHYSQIDKTWSKETLGTCNTTFGNDGCLLMCVSMFVYKDPREVNQLLKDQGGYSNGCLVNSLKAAKILELKYEGKTNIKPSYICIAETGHYKSKGVSQHFFVFAPKGTINREKDMILDPLDNPCDWKENKYSISSYRLFHENKPDPEFQNAWDEMMRKGVYSEYTKHNTPVTTDMLAVFLSRFDK